MCLDDQILSTYLDGELTEPWKSQVEEHLSYCAGCKERYEKLQSLRNTVKSAILTDEEIAPRQEKVLALIEKNKLSKKPSKLSFLKKRFNVSTPQIIGVAAAFVVVFIGSWAVFGGSSKDNKISLPDVSTTIDLKNITPVRSTDNTTTSKTLESYSLDEILKNLDARGYDVDIKLKSIQPLSLDKLADEEIREIAKIEERGIIIYSDGFIKDEKGSIIATGVKLNEDNQIVASDGTILFEGEKITLLPSNDAEVVVE
jgi:anti-sigma factor ChrR (cupin superfamily)